MDELHPAIIIQHRGWKSAGSAGNAGIFLIPFLIHIGGVKKLDPPFAYFGESLS